MLDADKIAHEALRREAPSYRKVVKAFGKHILDSDGRISRTKLAGIVFNNKKSLKVLCDIIHPEVIKRIKKNVALLSKSGKVSFVIIDAPLLIEAGLHSTVDYIVVVRTSERVQIKRVMKKTRLSYAEVLKRIRSQMPLGKKAGMADYIVDNGGKRAATKRTLRKIWEEIKSDSE